MDQTASSTLTASPRTEKGKGPARRLRVKGLIPAVVYGPSREPTHIAVDPALLQKAIATPHKFNTLLTLTLEGGQSKRVLFQDYEADPVSRQLLHADFLEVELDRPVRVQVPIVTTGRAEGVVEGGILTVSAHEITVEALPTAIPVRIEVDVTPLKIGGSIHIADVQAPAGVRIRYATNFTVAVISIPEKEEVVIAAPTAPVEGAAAPVAGAVAGAAPAGKPGDAKAAAPAAKGGDTKKK